MREAGRFRQALPQERQCAVGGCVPIAHCPQKRLNIRLCKQRRKCLLPIDVHQRALLLNAEDGQRHAARFKRCLHTPELRAKAARIGAGRGEQAADLHVRQRRGTVVNQRAFQHDGVLLFVLVLANTDILQDNRWFVKRKG